MAINKTNIKNSAKVASIKNDNGLFCRVRSNYELNEKLNKKQYKYWTSLMIMLAKSKIFMVSFLIVIIIILMALIVPIGHKTPVPALDPAGGFARVPDSKNWFGLDWAGRDYWLEIWFGIRTTLCLLLIIALVQIVIGVAIGSIWGFFAKLDILFINIINLISLVPSTIIIIICVIFFGRGFWPITFSVIITAWIGMSSVVRTNINYVKNTDYNIASITLGTPWYKILINNILPQIIPVLIQSISFIIPSTIALDMSLSYLGFEFVDGRTNTSIGWVLSTVLNNSEAAKGLYAVARYAYLLYIPMSISVILSISGYLMAKEFADIANPKNHR